MALRRLIFVVSTVIAAVVVLAPPEPLRSLERRMIGRLALDGHIVWAQYLYGAMAFVQRDTIANSNYHALNWYRAVPSGGSLRKKASIGADRAWRRAGKQGVASAYWNLAMFNIKHGRESKRRDRNSTTWLRWAARSGMSDAQLLLDAGDGEYDRIRVLMQMGDRGAAATMGRSLDRADQSLDQFEALRQAANAGHVGSMDRLGYLLATLTAEQASPTEIDDARREARQWLTRAAAAGYVLAAYRLGECHAEAILFCDARNPAAARKWFTQASGPYPRFQPPTFDLDHQYAIRFGMMARWYTDQSDIAAKARRALARL